ncbi:MAG: hypothetical protein RR277_01200 [Rikenellaceae bacterium]
MEDKTLNSKESLELITRMIAQTRRGYESGGGIALLVWGYTSVLVTALVTVLDHYIQASWINLLWWLIPLVGYTLMYLVMRDRVKPVKTYIDKVISYIWIVTGGVAVIFPFVALFSNFISFFIIPVESLILITAIIITGLVISFRPLVVGGCIALALSFSMYFISDFAYVFMALFVVAMIIPGHILNHRGKCSKS